MEIRLKYSISPTQFILFKNDTLVITELFNT